MSDLMLVALIIAVVLLWRRVDQLSDRVASLEFGESVPQAWSPDPVTAPVLPRASAAPEVFAREADRSPAPAPTPAPPSPPPSSPTITMEVPVAEPLATAAEPFGFEELFGRRLPIWAGGVTLAVAGFLIVKYSIDAGLLSPAVRVIAGFLFGVALIGGAETALRREALVRDPRVAQALSGAGVATLYAALLVAANIYALIGPGLAFAGMAAVTVLAGGLALRFGAPSAVLGLTGGLAAPALVGSGTPDIPLLAGYLALAIGGLCTLARQRNWLWLGTAALAGGFGWGFALILGGALDLAASLSVGLYTILLGIGLPVLLLGGRDATIRLLGALAGCGQMAALVANGGFTPLNWALFGLIALGGVWLSRREPELRPVAPVAFAVALLLMAAWPAATPPALAGVIGGAVLIFGAPAAYDLWRDRGTIVEAAQLSALAVAIPLLSVLHFALPADMVAALALAGTGLAGAVAASGWRAPTRIVDARFALVTVTAAGLIAWSGLAILPDWLDAPWAALVAGGLLLLSRRAEDWRIEHAAWIGAALTLLGLVTLMGTDDLLCALGEDRPANPLHLLSWGIPALVAVLFAWRGRIMLSARLAQPAAVMLAYIAAAQILSPFWLPLVAAALLTAIALLLRRDGAPGLVAATLLIGGWALEPIARWVAAGAVATSGAPAFVTSLPSITDAALRLAVPALALLPVAREDQQRRRLVLLLIGLLGMAAVHTGYKQFFAIDSLPAFMVRGLAERTGWELLLAVAAAAAYRRSRPVAFALGAASLAHFAWFTLVLHNPLWTDQVVPGIPVLNALSMACAVALLLLFAASREPLTAAMHRARAWAAMAVITFLTVFTVRHLAQGAMLNAPMVSDAENISYSLLGVCLALAFLRHGMIGGNRDWRLGSLLLMLAAVAKVFLLDAAGLDGLARIASFLGLGFSLIGIGWLYSRRPEPAR